MMASPLVDVAWAAARIDDPTLVLLDASITRSVGADGSTQFGPGQATFAAAHLPQARFADLYGAFSDPDAPYLFTRPRADQLDVALRQVGVGPESTIVIYDQLTGSYAARLWLVLRSYGVNARVLDGGFHAWTKAGHRVEAGPVEVVAGPGVTLQPDSSVFTDLDAAVALSERAVRGDTSAPALVCALREVEYLGDPARERSGHIPGSVSLPFPALLDTDGGYSADLTRALVAERGLTGRAVVAYCGGGVNAAGLALAFAHAGLELPQVFDGSLNEWRDHPELSVAAGPEPS